MCYIFNCFGWALDMIQRAITFFLACLLCGAVCVGLLVAIAAGIAYGYNYSMAEFLTFTKQDVTVYMRRGQFYDKPDIDLDREMFSRRADDGGEVVDDDPNTVNNYTKTVDYQEHRPKPDLRNLPDSWKQIKDTRKYSDVLTKFDSYKQPDTDEPEFSPIEPSMLPEPISVTPNPLVHTTVLRSGSSRIVMRNFGPGDIFNHESSVKQQDEFFYPDPDEGRPKSSVDYPVEKESKPQTSDIRIRMQDSLRPNKVPKMRHWRTTEKIFRDDLIEVDEDNVVYKPV